jgi:AraC-like DNA-binding protein
MNYLPQTNKAYALMIISLGFTSIAHALEGTTLTEETLLDHENIGIDDAIKFIHNINRYSHTPNWPALLGNHLGIATHGPVGYAAVSAPTIGRALTTFVQWFHIRSTSYIWKIVEQDETFEIEITDTSGDQEYKEFFFESFMRAFEVLVGLLLGHLPKNKTELYFEAHAENRQYLMKQEYDSSLYFGAATNKLVIPKVIWFLPSPLYDQDSHEFNVRKCRQLSEQAETKGRVDMQVRNLIRQHIEKKLVKEITECSLPTLIDTCEVLHLTERTLIRKLNKSHTSYKQILEEERKLYADKLLKDASYTVFSIAEILGYNESANFCRAFKKWYGQSPAHYRRNRKF